MIKRMTHTGFVVKDRDKAVEFYRDVVGLTLLRTSESEGSAISGLLGYDDVSLKGAALSVGDGHVLELLQYVSPVGADRPSDERSTLGASHLAFEVEDLDETCQRLIANGAKGLNPPVEMRAGSKACYLQDPDGNWLELSESSG